MDTSFSWDQQDQSDPLRQRSRANAPDLGMSIDGFRTELPNEAADFGLDRPSFAGINNPAGETPAPTGGMPTATAVPSGSRVPSTGPLTPSTASAPTAPAAGAGQRASGYRQTVEQIRTTQDPKQQAILKDQLSRSLYSDLKTQGHDVKWQGNQLIIDGRPYIVGGDDTAAASGIQSEEDSVVVDPPPVDHSEWDTDGYDPPQYTAGAAGAAPSGWDQAKWDNPSHQTPKYVGGRIFSNFDANDPAQVSAAAAEVAKAYPGAQFNGKDKIRLPWGEVIDFVENASGPGPKRFAWQSDRDPQNAPAPQSAPGLTSSIAAPGAAGVPVSGEQPSAYAPPNQGAPASNQFNLSAPTYTPGEISDDDIPNFSFEQMLSQLKGDQTDAQLEEMILSYLKNPESLDALTVDTMKAKSKDELAEMAELDEQELRALGASMGIDDSPWLASELMSTRRGRDRALVESNRNIDLEAATTRGAERRAAAEMGASYANSRTSQKQAMVALAADTSLKTAALRGDRMAFRESIKQKATELGLAADQLQLNYTMGLIDDATRRYGINVGASIDREKLAQAGREFQEELAFKIMALEQAERQFGAQYGLDFAKTQHQIDEDHYQRYERATDIEE